MLSGKLNITVTTLEGLEEVLKEEIQFLIGKKKFEERRRALTFEGNIDDVYMLNLWLRTGIRVLINLGTFPAATENDIYKAAKSLPYEDIVDLDAGLRVDTVSFSKVHTNTQFLTFRVKDGIVDRFRDKLGDRPNIVKGTAGLKVHALFREETMTLSLDTSGRSLHQRGYKDQSEHQAPLNEVLAAGLVLMLKPEKILYDPMCGTGTFSIEAALMKKGVPPRVGRTDYSFKKYKAFDAFKFKALAQEKKPMLPEDLKIEASDLARPYVSKARMNAQTAFVDDEIKFSCKNFFDLKPKEDEGSIILNPPYGERMEADVDFYKEIGFKIKEFTRHKAIVLSSDYDLLKHVGLKPNGRYNLDNGGLDTFAHLFEVYKPKPDAD